MKTTKQRTREPTRQHRSPDNVGISISMPRDLHEEIKERAQAEGRNISEWVRWNLGLIIENELEPQRRP